jgi:formyltetrahydrofolate hydrolase
MIQAVITPEHRGGLGMHYTSVPNIMKVIEPLFLNDFYEEFESSKGNPKRLRQLLNRLWNAKFFDPACGSGNFLIITYKELRKLEMKIFKELNEMAFSNISLNQFYGIEFNAHQITTSADKSKFESMLRDYIHANGVELIVLARYMQILSEEFCKEFEGKIINIHHSFLPGFKGADPYAQAHARGVKLIGATAHFVTADLDEGPIIEQNVVRVEHADSRNSLVSIGQDVESKTLTQAVRWFAERRVLLDGERTIIFS